MHDSAEQIVDEILVLDAQNGRRPAFDALVSRWQKRLWSHAYRLTGQSEAAWDVTQEAWLSIVRGLGRLEEPARFGSWAYRIVGNKVADWLRRHGRLIAAEEALDEIAEPAGESGREESVRDVQAILHHLPRESREMLRLFYLEGFAVAEIASIVGAPVGTVKSRLHTARAAFRRYWEQLGGRAPVPVSTLERTNNHE